MELKWYLFGMISMALGQVIVNMLAWWARRRQPTAEAHSEPDRDASNAAQFAKDLIDAVFGPDGTMTVLGKIEGNQTAGANATVRRMASYAFHERSRLLNLVRDHLERSKRDGDGSVAVIEDRET